MSTPTSLIVRKALAYVEPQFRLDFNDGIHGVAHWSRVWMHGKALANDMDLNPSVLAWFAFLHDSNRHNDHEDPFHGQRAADFALRLRRDSVIDELNDVEFEQLCEAMCLHSDGHTESDPMIRACWDSDRLDLGRAGYTPDPRLLCTSYARRPDVIEEAMRRSLGQPRSEPDQGQHQHGGFRP